jgi:ethanolamine utilization microcompartment shell protein EutL
MEDHLSLKNTDITNRGKTIRNLINELQSFENLDQEVFIAMNAKKPLRSIGLVGRIDEMCALIAFDDE